jgi:protein SCO1/2
MMRALFVALLFPLVLLAAGCGGSSDSLPGTDLGRAPASDFRLTDAAGQTVSLSDLRGQPVAVAFLYTRCPDVCPLIAARLAQALTGLGDKADDVAVLAVSVDPEGDTPETARAFMQAHGLTGDAHHYLLGDAAALAPVWLAYGVASTPALEGPAPVGHTDAVVLVDREGRKRTLLRGEATVDEYRRGLQVLLR